MSTKQKEVQNISAATLVASADTAINMDGQTAVENKEVQSRPREIGGPAGPEPTRYGDWQKNGRCSDF